MFFKTDPDKMNNIWMIELKHDESLHQEIQLSLIRTSQITLNNFCIKVAFVKENQILKSVQSGPHFSVLFEDFYCVCMVYNVDSFGHFLKLSVQKDYKLTGLGLDSRRNDLRSPPANNSKMMNLGCFSKQTPIK